MVPSLFSNYKFLIKDLFSKYDQIHSLLRIWSSLLKKSLMENSVSCAEIFKAWPAICTSVVCEFISEQYRSSHPECSVRKVLLESPQISQKNTCATVSF